MVIEGAATRLVPELEGEQHPLHKLWRKTLDAGLVHGVCKACAQKMGTLAAAKELGLAPLDDMNGHPSITGFREQGYEIITF